MFKKYQIKQYQVFIDQILLLIVCSFLYFGFLGSARLWDFDEAYFTVIARDMFRQNEWIVPIYNNSELISLHHLLQNSKLEIQYADKPILIFWGMLVSFTLFGVTEFAARFPSAIWSLGTILVTYHLGLRLFNRAVAIRAAFILGTMLVFVLEARGATCDAPFIFGINAATLVFVWSAFPRQQLILSTNRTSRHSDSKNETAMDSDTNRDDPPFLADQEIKKESIPAIQLGTAPALLIYFLLSISVLAKGPAGLILPLMVFGLFTLWENWCAIRRQYSIARSLVHLPLEGERAVFQLRMVLGVVIVLLVAGPWYLIVGMETDWKWPEQFFMTHNLARASGVMEGHSGNFLFYPASFLFGTFPWSLFAIPVVLQTIYDLRNVRRPRFYRRAMTFCVFAVLFYIIFFSFVQTKLPHYIAPMFPMAALLYAVFLERWQRNCESISQYWTPVVWRIMILVGICITTALWTAIAIYLPNVSPILPIMLGLVLLLGGIAGLVCVRKWPKNRPIQEKIFCSVSFLFVLLLFQWGATRISQEVVNPSLAGRTTGNEVFVTFGALEPSWTLYSGSAPYFMADGYSIPRLNKKDMDELCDQLSKFPGLLNRIRLIVPKQQLDESISGTFGELMEVDKEIPYFLKNRQLVIMRPKLPIGYKESNDSQMFGIE
ncbi:MAG: ArnT family glycosyltransferase [Thermoguttaceae bacterium]